MMYLVEKNSLLFLRNEEVKLLTYFNYYIFLLPNTTMNILHIAQCAGGVDRYLSMLLPLLKEFGLQQVLICSFDYKKEDYIGKVDKIEQLNIGQSLSPFSVLKNVLSIRKLIKKYNPDIVYCHSSIAGGLGRIACLGLPTKIVYNPHGWAFNMK